MSEQEQYNTATSEEVTAAEPFVSTGGQEVAEGGEELAVGSEIPVEEETPQESEQIVVPPTATAAEDLDKAVYAIRLLTAVAVGSVVEGGSQLVKRLTLYEEEVQRQQQAAAESGEAEQEIIVEDEYDRLRYALVGLLFDAQTRLGRGISLAAQLTDSTIDTAEKVTSPFRNFFLFRPVTKRLENRFDQLIARGQENLAHWIDIGREVEPESRALATLTYGEIVDEFISMLAENEEIRTLIAQQSASMAAGVRDEVRERTVTVDNVVEDLARRVLRREPRESLPEPPPEVRRWAGVTPEDFKELEQETLDEQSGSS